ncbi:MAG: AI-2E family transporter [Nitrospira sp.]|nr:AI-2E family transporter [Nitrospira sp.]
MMTRRQLFGLIFLLVFLVLLWQLVRILEPFFPPLTWAIILATATYPLHTRLWRVVGRRSNLAAALMTVLVLLAVVLPAIYGIILAGHQAVEAYDQVAAWLKEGRVQDFGALLGEIPGVGPALQRLVGEAIVSRSESIQTSLLEGGKVISSFLISQSVDFAMNAFLLATDFVVMIFTLFFVFRDGELAFARVCRAIPLEEEHKAKILTRLQTTLHAVVRGTLLTALAQGAVSGMIYFALGLPFATFLGFLSFIVSFLPFGGTALVWVPLALYLLFTGAMVKAIILVAAGVGLVGLLDNLLQPILVGAEARLPLLPLFFVSIGGLAYYGFLGLFLGPILLAAVLETFAIYQDEYQQRTSDLIVSAESFSTGLPEADLMRGEEHTGIV